MSNSDFIKKPLESAFPRHTRNTMDYHNEGHDAYKSGVNFFANPYAKPSGAQLGYYAWSAGWMTAWQEANGND